MNELEPTPAEQEKQGIESQPNQQKQDVSNDKKPPRTIEELEKEVDAIVIIPNDRLLAISDKETTFKDAFAMCDEVLRQAVEGITDLITTPGIINVGFADIRAIMFDAGSALMGIGRASGGNRAEDARRVRYVRSVREN